MNMNMNMQEHINDLIEYKRLVIKLEDELKKKSSENAILSKQNLDLKSLCQDLQMECDELNKKLISKNSEMKKLDKKYKDEMEKVSKSFEKQKEIYEEKIFKLSSINPINKEISIKREVEVRYEEKLKEKNEEIGILKNKIKNLNDENYDLRCEIERIKSLQNKFDVIKQENDLMKDLVRQEDNQKEGNIIDNNNDNKLKEMQLIIKEKEEYIEKLCQEINKLKNEKNIYETNLSKKYFIDLGQITELENKNNLLKRDLLKKDEVIKDIEKRLLDLRKVAEKINKEKEEMEQENNNLLTKINELEKENNNDEIQKDLDNLRELVQNYETEQHNNSIINEKIKKQNEEKNKNKINELQKKLEEEKEKFSNYVESNNFQSNNNFINIISYKNNEQSSNNIFKNEYEKIRVKYNSLLVEQRRMNNEMKQKEEENESLNKYLKEAAKKEKQRKEKYYQLKEKYKILLDKKEHYKELCKISKKNMENLINLMNPELKKSIESSENKYLIDTDSFSFTET